MCVWFGGGKQLAASAQEAAHICFSKKWGKAPHDTAGKRQTGALILLSGNPACQVWKQFSLKIIEQHGCLYHDFGCCRVWLQEGTHCKFLLISAERVLAVSLFCFAECRIDVLDFYKFESSRSKPYQTRTASMFSMFSWLITHLFWKCEIIVFDEGFAAKPLDSWSPWCMVNMGVIPHGIIFQTC